MYDRIAVRRGTAELAKQKAKAAGMKVADLIPLALNNFEVVVGIVTPKRPVSDEEHVLNELGLNPEDWRDMDEVKFRRLMGLIKEHLAKHRGAAG